MDGEPVASAMHPGMPNKVVEDALLAHLAAHYTGAPKAVQWEADGAAPPSEAASCGSAAAEAPSPSQPMEDEDVDAPGALDSLSSLSTASLERHHCRQPALVLAGLQAVSRINVLALCAVARACKPVL